MGEEDFPTPVPEEIEHSIRMFLFASFITEGIEPLGLEEFNVTLPSMLQQYYKKGSSKQEFIDYAQRVSAKIPLEEQLWVNYETKDVNKRRSAQKVIEEAKKKYPPDRIEPVEDGIDPQDMYIFSVNYFFQKKSRLN